MCDSYPVWLHGMPRRVCKVSYIGVVKVRNLLRRCPTQGKCFIHGGTYGSHSLRESCTSDAQSLTNGVANMKLREMVEWLETGESGDGRISAVR